MTTWKGKIFKSAHRSKGVILSGFSTVSYFRGSEKSVRFPGSVNSLCKVAHFFSELSVCSQISMHFNALSWTLRCNQDSFTNLHWSTTGWYWGESHDVTEVDGDGRVALGEHRPVARAQVLRHAGRQHLVQQRLGSLPLRVNRLHLIDQSEKKTTRLYKKVSCCPKFLRNVKNPRMASSSDSG